MTFSVESKPQVCPTCLPLVSPRCLPLVSPTCLPLVSPRCLPLVSPTCLPLVSPRCLPPVSPRCLPPVSPRCLPPVSPRCPLVQIIGLCSLAHAHELSDQSELTLDRPAQAQINTDKSERSLWHKSVDL
ncbi:unnamed protein product [Knipowitschia caucasica]